MMPLISVKEAQDRLLSVAYRTEEEIVTLQDALGRILFSDVFTEHDVPRFDRAMLDGYAVRAEDTRGATRALPKVLRVVDTVGAGTWPVRPCPPGSAVRTMTGAPMTPGTDALLRLEYTEAQSDGAAEAAMFAEVSPGEAVQRRGELQSAGSVLLPAGLRLTDLHIAMLAGQGIAEVRVAKQPTVGVMATGSELVPIGTALQPAQIFDSNSYLLSGMARTAGGIPRSFGCIADDRALLYERLSVALATCDIVVTSGGVSVGDFDLVPHVLQSLGVQTLFWGVWIRPGTPVFAGVKDRTIVLAVSGNPGAAYVNAAILLLPLIEFMLGLTQGSCITHAQARVRNLPAKKKVRHARYLRGFITQEQGEWWIDLGGNQSPGTLLYHPERTGLAQIEPDADPQEGDIVPILLV